MSKPKTPEYPSITAPTVAQGGDLYGQAQNFFQQNGYGNLLTAQSNALNNANDPNYYASFQPTSFEQALGNQQFQNVWPDEQAQIMNQLSKSGMAYSPVAATTIGNAYGNLSTNIGEYLNTQANNRASGAIQAGLGINPMSFLSPYANLGAQQSNQQGQFNFDAQKQNADASYSNSLAKYQQQNSQNAAIGTAIGGVGGFMLGGPAGAMMGAGLGGSLMGGGQGGQNMGSYLQGSQMLPSGGFFGGNSGGNGVNFVDNAAGGGSSMSGFSSALPSFANGAMGV